MLFPERLDDGSRLGKEFFRVLRFFRETERLFISKKLLLAALDAIPHALPCDSGIFRNLRKRQVIVIVEIKHGFLRIREKLAVKIKQHDKVKIFFKHRMPPHRLCKADSFTKYSMNPCACQAGKRIFSASYKYFLQTFP